MNDMTRNEAALDNAMPLKHMTIYGFAAFIVAPLANGIGRMVMTLSLGPGKMFALVGARARTHSLLPTGPD